MKIENIAAGEANTELLPMPGLFYRRRGLLVTTDHLLAGGGYYEIAGLADIRTGRGRAHTGPLVGLAIAAVEVVLLLPFADQFRSPIGFLVAALALAIPCVVGALCARIWRPRMELTAEYHGRPVVLYATSDHLEFAQVVRALHRAVEASRRARAH